MRRQLSCLLGVVVLLSGCLGRPTVTGPSATDPGPGTASDTRALAPAPAPAEPQYPRTPDRWLTNAQNAFTFDLFEAVQQRAAPGQNLFLSPLSVALVLSMTYNGADGLTAGAMAKTLHLEGRSLADINQQASTLQSGLAQGDGAARTELHNAIWYRKGFTPNKTFLESARTHYTAEVAALDFGSHTAVRSINQWISKATHGRIEQMLTETQPGDLMYLANTVYFKAPWAQPFDPAQTKQLPFHLPGGATASIPMMSQRGAYHYTQTQTFQAVALTAGYYYGVLLVLPSEGVPPATALAELRRAWPLELPQRLGRITIPKLKLSYDTALKQPLTDLGMGIAFTPEADLSGIAESRRERLLISDVIHKTFLEMHEEGVEAAAASLVGMLAGEPDWEPFDLVVDRPYLLAITAPGDQILFLGAINDPR